jgi:gliding motility-associated-like protein
VDNDLYNDGFEDSRMEVSGVLTPNTNGVESTWKITNINLHPLNKVAIYNTNGVEVFATENYDNSWDGTYKGTTRRVPAGSYLYKVYLYDTRETLTGWLYIAY